MEKNGIILLFVAALALLAPGMAAFSAGHVHCCVSYAAAPLPDELPPVKRCGDLTPAEIRGEGSSPGTIPYYMWTQDCLALGYCSAGLLCQPDSATHPCKCQ